MESHGWEELHLSRQKMMGGRMATLDRHFVKTTNKTPPARHRNCTASTSLTGIRSRTLTQIDQQTTPSAFSNHQINQPSSIANSKPRRLCSLPHSVLLCSSFAPLLQGKALTRAFSLPPSFLSSAISTRPTDRPIERIARCLLLSLSFLSSRTVTILPALHERSAGVNGDTRRRFLLSPFRV